MAEKEKLRLDQISLGHSVFSKPVHKQVTHAILERLNLMAFKQKHLNM
jgi:hypothetical protein